MNLARFIEHRVTNGVDYNTKTNFTINNPKTFLRYPLQEEDIRSSKYALQAHLAHLEYRIWLPIAVRTNTLLKNAPENHPFRLRSSWQGKILSEKQRIRDRKRIVRAIRFFRKYRDSHILLAQSRARISVLKNGKDISNLIPAFLLSFSSENKS